MGRKWLKKEDCKYCRNEEYFYEEITEVYCDGSGYSEFLYIKDMDFKYCPYCGRKLVEE